MNCDTEVRRDLFSNIVLSGGTTSMPGFAERLRKELRHFNSSAAVLHEATAVSVCSSDSAWIGGSIFASQDIFQQKWMSKQEYDETGPSIVHIKCF